MREARRFDEPSKSFPPLRSSNLLYEASWERQREHARIPEAVMGKVLRGSIAEGKCAEAVRHGLKRMRYVGRQMALLQSTLVAFILNITRFLRIKAQSVNT